MKRWLCGLLVFWPFLLVAHECSLSTGYRFDYLKWNIGWEGCNIASELEWCSHAAELTARGGYCWSPQVYLEAEGGYGVMLTGADRDSDYLFDDRRGEMCRSHSRVRGWVADLVLDFAFVWPRLEHLLSRYGLACNYQKFISYDGNVVLAIDREGIYTGKFPLSSNDVNATYKALWVGPWVGLEGCFRVGNRSHMKVELRFHDGFFLGEGDWKLRDDLNIFYDRALFIGGIALLSWEWVLGRCGCLALSLRGAWRVATRGKQVGSTTWGERLEVRLNEARWTSLTAVIALRW